MKHDTLCLLRAVMHLSEPSTICALVPLTHHTNVNNEQNLREVSLFSHSVMMAMYGTTRLAAQGTRVKRTSSRYSCRVSASSSSSRVDAVASPPTSQPNIGAAQSAIRRAMLILAFPSSLFFSSSLALFLTVILTNDAIIPQPTTCPSLLE